MPEIIVAGIGVIPFGRYPEATVAGMGAAAARLALRDAGMAPGRVGAGYFANVLAATLEGDTAIGQNVFAEVGVTGVPVVNVENACTSGSTAIYLAVNAIRAGEIDTALVVGAEKMSIPGLGLISGGRSEIETRLGLVTPASFALRAARHMHDFGTTARQMAEIVVKNRRHAALNAGALFTTPVTAEEVLDAPMVADPLTRLQCCPVADGAAAIVLAAATGGEPRRAIRVDAAILCSGGYPDVPDLSVWETDHRACGLAYDKAGLEPADVDVVECHDAFSIAEILHYEALRLCRPGAGGRLAASGDTALGGRVPVNVSGGLLGRGHPLAATGVAQVVEVTLQLRGEGGVRQVEGARVGIAHCMGGDRAGDARSCTVIALSR